MSRPDLAVVAGKPNPDKDIEALIRHLALLCSVYEAPPVSDVSDAASYTSGFRNGARSAYADVIGRLRDLRAGVE